MNSVHSVSDRLLGVRGATCELADWRRGAATARRCDGGAAEEADSGSDWRCGTVALHCRRRDRDRDRARGVDEALAVLATGRNPHFGIPAHTQTPLSHKRAASEHRAIFALVP